MDHLFRKVRFEFSGKIIPGYATFYKHIAVKLATGWFVSLCQTFFFTKSFRKPQHHSLDKVAPHSETTEQGKPKFFLKASYTISIAQKYWPRFIFPKKQSSCQDLSAPSFSLEMQSRYKDLLIQLLQLVLAKKKLVRKLSHRDLVKM